MRDHFQVDKQELEHKNLHMIVQPVQFGVLKTPSIEYVCFSEQQRETILQQELQWILDHRS